MENKTKTFEPVFKSAWDIAQEHKQEVSRNKESEFSEDEFHSNLSQFSGTLGYHKSSFGRLKLTDGVHFLRITLNCFWLIDIIESTQLLKKIKENFEFIVWKIEVNLDKSFKVTAWTDMPYDLSSILLYEQKGEYTDFPLKSFEVWQEGNVLLLPREH